MWGPPLASGLTWSTCSFGPPHIQQPGQTDSRAASWAAVKGTTVAARFRARHRRLNSRLTSRLAS